MATSKYDPMKTLNRLKEIVDTAESMKSTGREQKALAKMWTTVADRFTEAATGGSPDPDRAAQAILSHKAAEGLAGLTEAATLARDIAQRLAPAAAADWSDDELNDLIVSVRFFLIDGRYKDENIELASNLVNAARSLKPRPSKVLEGRPHKIVVTTLAGEKICSQRGDGPSASGNIASAIRKWLERQEVVCTDEMTAAIREAVSRSVKGEPEVALGDFAVIRHAE